MTQIFLAIRALPRAAALAAIALTATAGNAPAQADSVAAANSVTMAGGLTVTDKVRVAAVIDAATVQTEDGRVVRLEGIETPAPPLGYDGDQPWPFADEALASLTEMTVGKTLSLAPGGAPYDRYGRLRGHLFGKDGTWIQARLVALGLARVASLSDARAGIARLLRAESIARAKRHGIWASDYYRPIEADAAAQHIGSFQLVEGRVLAVAVVRDRAYLNFGADWHTDFTVSLSAKTQRLFAGEGFDIVDYEGLRVRVRGWIHSLNGPMIDVTHPEQIEVLP